MARILVIDDNDSMREGIAHTVRRMGHQVETAASGAAGLAAFEARGADFVISDLKMDGLDGLGVLSEIRKRDPQAILMIVTGFGSVDAAVAAMKLGAFDFITKPFPPEVIRLKVQAALSLVAQREQHEKLARHNEILSEQLERNYPVAGSAESLGIVGSSPALQQVLARVRRVAQAESTVHIYGESGTGKELVARALHRASGRAKGPFIKVSCAALAESVLESELFGHERGAFTSAGKRRLGRFELADGGTLFLDEIGDISPAVQVKLLRVLQEREFERVGGEETVRVDVRVVSATHRDLKALVEQGRFREDLYYRLHIVPIELPPLRARPEDIPLLAQHFVEKLAQRTGSPAEGLSPEAQRALSQYPWPGNVRELENVMEQAMVFCDHPVIRLEDLPSHVSGARAPAALPTLDGQQSLPEILENMERQLIEQAYAQAEGMKTECARLLGIKTSALYYKLEKYGLWSSTE